jgi:uncharacterized protein (DUF2062 family)
MVAGSAEPRGNGTGRGLRARLAKALADLKAEHGSPGKVGLAVGLGAFSGCSPFHGFQFLLALGLAYVFRVNKLLVLLGLQVSAPPLTPVVIFAGLQLGVLMRHGRFLPLGWRDAQATLGAHAPRQLLIDFTLGSLALGAAVGLVLGTGTWLWLSRKQKVRGP